MKLLTIVYLVFMTILCSGAFIFSNRGMDSHAINWAVSAVVITVIQILNVVRYIKWRRTEWNTK